MFKLFLLHLCLPIFIWCRVMLHCSDPTQLLKIVCTWWCLFKNFHWPLLSMSQYILFLLKFLCWTLKIAFRLNSQSDVRNDVRKDVFWKLVSREFVRETLRFPWKFLGFILKKLKLGWDPPCRRTCKKNFKASN